MKDFRKYFTRKLLTAGREQKQYDEIDVRLPFPVKDQPSKNIITEEANKRGYIVVDIYASDAEQNISDGCTMLTLIRN